MVHLAPDSPRFDIGNLERLATRVVTTTRNRTLDGTDRNGSRYRLRAIASYDDDDVANMAIVVVGDREPALRAHAAFVRGIATTSAFVALLGIAVGALLARRNLEPVAETYEQRERFLGGAAHELRNPMAALRAICESARAGDEDAEAALERLFPVVLRTGALVENLLLYARLDAERIDIEPTDVRLDLLVEACLPEDDGVRFRGDECVVRADARLLETAVANLVSNALRHGGADGPVGVTVDATGNGRRVVVDDRGPGFSPDLLADAGAPFVTSPASPGVGLGLALARLIVELHGGSLTLANRPDGGARATIELPAPAVS